MRIFSLVLFLFCSLTAQAVVVADLFEARVKVEDQSSEHREQALQDAFAQALIKLSGNSESIQHELIQEQTLALNKYVRSYRYMHSSIDNSLQLEVIFAQNLLESLLAQANLPIWGKSRPLILVWQAVEENLQRTVLSQQNSLWQMHINEAMYERGLPILWPALDLEDQVALSEGSLWGLFQSDIAAASERYFADAILAGRISQLNNGKWAYRGFLSHQQERIELSEQDTDASVLARKISAQIAEYLARHYAVLSNQNSEMLHIEVQNINSFQDYSELLAYLNANVAVKKVEVVKVKDEQVTLSLQLSTDWAQVWSVLSLDKRLNTTEQLMTYTWQR